MTDNVQLRRSLQRTLGELRDYQKRHEEWLSLQQKLLLEQATPEMKLESRLEYEEQKIRESTDGRGWFKLNYYICLYFGSWDFGSLKSKGKKCLGCISLNAVLARPLHIPCYLQVKTVFSTSRMAIHS